MIQGTPDPDYISITSLLVAIASFIASLVSASELVELESLTLRQYIGLRFASNPELPALARRAIREKLTEKQIKEAIVSWRPDNDRI